MAVKTRGVVKVVLCCLLALAGLHCNPGSSKMASATEQRNLETVFSDYWEERMQLFPLEATQNGDHRYNDRLTIVFTETFRDTLRDFYSRYLQKMGTFSRDALEGNHRISYDIFKSLMETNLEELRFPGHVMPFNQLWALPLDMGLLGSGKGNQPFRTAGDYANWNKRARFFSAWADSAITYFRKGMDSGIVLPRALVLKMIPQMRSLSTRDTAKNVFVGPLRTWPQDLPAASRDSAARELLGTITGHLQPAYDKLADFLQQEYLPRTRATSGIQALPGGEPWYRFLVRYWTTTDKTPETIYQTGLAEVRRIREEMETIKGQVGFSGSLNAFFEHLKTNPKLMPFRTAEEVLDAFRGIQQKIEPHLQSMFGRTPKTPFEIRATESFRAASASAEYQQGTADGSRPGVFYIPILDPRKFNITSGMESLFLHEAIPGHHYQLSLQQENEQLPKFRRFAWYGAFGEGWALYCESMGKELGLYKDPYQYMGALGDEIHRAIRLVVDVALHTGRMSREEAIRYMMDNEAISEDGAVAEIERYMALPGQALSYKIGALKIRELRQKYQNALGDKFRISAFHDEFLKDGVMPLQIAEMKMDAWVKGVK